MWGELYVDALLHHCGDGTYLHCKLIGVVVEFGIDGDTVLQYFAIEVSVEDVVVRLGVLQVCLIAHLQGVVAAFYLGGERVELVALCGESVEFYGAVDAVLA